MLRRIVLLARAPRAGAVKTRLSPALGERAALALYHAFVTDQLAFLGSFARDHEVEWCIDGDPPPDLARIAASSDVRVSHQVEGDLGARLAAVFESQRGARASATVVIGADSPTLPADRVRAGLDRLTRSGGAVVVPAEDGGYALIGMCRPVPELFRDIPWSSALVLERTRERARDAGVDLAEIGGWYDVDDRTGLDHLIAELGDPVAALRAPATARAILDLSLGRMV